VAWKKGIKADWGKISIKSVEIGNEAEAFKGHEAEVFVSVDTAGHHPSELNVELLHGPVDLRENFKVRHISPLAADESRPRENGCSLFSGLIPLSHTGLYGYVVRVTARHPNLPASQRLDLVHRG